MNIRHGAKLLYFKDFEAGTYEDILDESLLSAIKSIASKIVSFLQRKLSSIKWGQKQFITIPIDVSVLNELNVKSLNTVNLSGDINEPCTRFYLLHKLAAYGFKVKEGSIEVAKAKYLENRRAWNSALKTADQKKRTKVLRNMKMAVEFSDKMSDHIVEAVAENPDSSLMMYDAIDSSKGDHNDTADVTVMAKKFSEDEMHRLVGLSLKAMVDSEKVRLGRFADAHGSSRYGCFFVIDYIVTGDQTPSSQFLDKLPALLKKYEKYFSIPNVVKGMTAFINDPEFKKGETFDGMYAGKELWHKRKKEIMTLKPNLFPGGLDWADKAGGVDRVGALLAFHMDRVYVSSNSHWLSDTINTICTEMLNGSKDKITLAGIKRLLDGIEIGNEHTLIYGAIAKSIGNDKNQPGFDVFTTHSADFKKLVDGSLDNLTLDAQKEGNAGSGHFVVKHDGKKIFSVGYDFFPRMSIQFTLNKEQLESFNNFGYKFQDPSKLRKSIKLPA